MRINTVLLAGFAAIALPGFITAGQVTFMNWQRVRLAEDAALASRVVSSAQRAHTAFALESGFINLAAQSAHPDPAALQASAMETDRLLQAARESVAAAGLPADNLAVVTTAIATLRGRLQTIIAQNESKRDPGFGREVLTVREKAGDVLIGLEQQAARRVSVEEPSLSPLLEASEQLMDVRDALGRRNIVLTNWIAGQAIKPAEMAVVDGLTYRMSHSWESASRQFNIIGGPPSLIQEKERQQEIFVKQNEPRWQKVIELARAGATSDPAWPKDAISYRGWTTPALAEIVKLRDLVLDAAVERSGLLLAEAEWRMLIAIGLVGVTIACLAGVVVLLRRRVVRPLSRITQAVELLAAGDLEADVSERDRRDEVGAVARAVQTLKEGALKAREAEAEQAEARSRRAAEDARVREEAAASAAAAAASLVVGSIGAALERLAAGDLTFRLDTPLPEAYEQLRLNLNTAMEELHALVRNIVANTSMIHAGTEEITKAADDLSQRTERQAATLEQTAAALDQITATVRKTAEGASHARAVVAKTRDGAEQSGSVVEKAVTAMACIEQSSKQVSQIIGVIDEIAFQTNLLALNAGVEAARAGEAGRGFAVVASEVRALAQRSASAAREIKGLISTSAQQVGDGVKLVGDTGQALKRMVAQVTEINAVIADIAASAQEQATGLHEVNTAINQMDQVTQQNAAMVEQTTAASHSLEKEAVELTHLTARFQVGEATSAGVPATAARPQPKTTVPPARKPRAAPVQGNTATARKLAPAENQWEEF